MPIGHNEFHNIIPWCNLDEYVFGVAFINNIYW